MTGEKGADIGAAYSASALLKRHVSPTGDGAQQYVLLDLGIHKVEQYGRKRRTS